MEKDKNSVCGLVKIDIFNADGTIKEAGSFDHNMITNAGLAELTLLGSGLGGTAFTYLELGTSNTAESATHTTLQAAITNTGLQRASAIVTRTTTTTANDTWQLVVTWTATGTKVVEEIGIFNASSGGVMLGRKLTGTKTINDSESITATYQIVLSRAS